MLVDAAVPNILKRKRKDRNNDAAKRKTVRRANNPIVFASSVSLFVAFFCFETTMGWRTTKGATQQSPLYFNFAPFLAVVHL